MNCKYCQQMLDEGSTICPHCGKDNAEEMEEVVTAEENAPVEAVEETAPSAEIKKGITLTPGKLALVIGAVVVLTAIVIALVLQGAGVLKPSADMEETVPTAVAAEPVGTVPADGNPDDETCKGSYTVSDDEVIAAMDTIVAACGDVKLTNAELQIYYWMQVQQFLGNYGSYASYFGLDYTQPLDTQVCGLVETGITWQQFFLAQALDSWHNYQALANEAAAAGMELSEENQTYVDGIPAALATEGGLQGFESAESYLAYHVGAGASIEDYVHYMETYYRGFAYFEEQYENLLPTAEEIEAYFTENAAAYEEQGITRETVNVDARHILVFPEGGTTDESGLTTYSDEEWEACRVKAQAILDEWLEGEATEDSFAALANEKSEDPGSNTNGGLYEDIYEGQMVEPFENWCFDASRQYGDTGLVRTNYGYHVMFYVGSTPVWEGYAEEDLISQRANAMVLDVMNRHPLTVDYKAICLGFVDMGA